MHIFGKEEWFNFEINLGQVHYCHSILSFHIDISLCHIQLLMSCHVIFIKWPHLYVCHYTTTATIIASYVNYIHLYTIKYTEVTWLPFWSPLLITILL
jgi:hypothetical protein